MAGTNILVTESFLAANFTPKNGHTPGSDNSIHLDCDTIISRYYVTIQGLTSTGNRCPAQNQLVSAIPVNIPEYLHFTSDYITKVSLSNDGSKLYLTRQGGTYAYVEQYNLSVSNYIGSKVLSTSYSFSSGVYDNVDCFSPDGNYVFCTNGFIIKRYTLGTAWNISTLQSSSVQSSNLSSWFNTSSTMSVSFNSNGSYMTASTIRNGYIKFVVFYLPVSYSLATVNYSSEGTSNGTVSAVAGFEYNSNGTVMYIMNSFNLASILEYPVSGSAYQPFSTQTFNVSYNYTQNMDTSALSRDFCLSADKQYVYIVSGIGGGSQTLAQFRFGTFSTVFMNDPAIKVAYIDCPNHGTITSSTLTVRIGVTDNGYNTVSQAGAIWSTSNTSPTFLTSYTNSIGDGTSGVHDTCLYITGLSPSTTYYIRAWSLNSVGYSYSTVYSFTTTALVTTTTTTQVGAGYYNCGYGCQYYTYNPGCTPCVTSVYITNNSLDISVNNVVINGVGISSASFPVLAGNNTAGTTTEFGTYNISVYINGVSTPQNIEVYDSNNTLTCQDYIDNGAYIFYDQVITPGSSISIYVNTGSCA